MNPSKRIYAAFLASVGLWCLAIIAAPLLSTYGGATGASIADALYLGFSKICHQIDGRSLHLCGAKFGVCVRCSSIYFSFFAGLLVYPFLRRLDSRQVPDKRWLLLAIVPMAVDAFLNDAALHASDDVTRIVTGSVAGFTFAFFVLPLFIEAVRQLLDHRKFKGETSYAGQTQ